MAFQTVKAQSVATATLTSGGMNSITIGSNGIFPLTLGVTTNFITNGYTVFYQSNNGQGLFQITSLTYIDPILRFGGNPIFPQLLNPWNMSDLGAGSGPGPDIIHLPGTFDLQRITISALNAPIGTYTIFLSNLSIMVDRTGGGFSDVNMGGSTGPIFTVNVVPEPTTVALSVMGGAVVLVVAWRKRRAAA